MIQLCPNLRVDLLHRPRGTTELVFLFLDQCLVAIIIIPHGRFEMTSRFVKSNVRFVQLRQQFIRNLRIGKTPRNSRKSILHRSQLYHQVIVESCLKRITL